MSATAACATSVPVSSTATTAAACLLPAASSPATAHAEATAPAGTERQLPASALPQPQPSFRLVLPAAKQQRLRDQLQALAPRRTCPAPGCAEMGLSVLLVETERAAVLCPRHALVHLDGQPCGGQPVLATAAW